jgi:hypothetical protein
MPFNKKLLIVTSTLLIFFLIGCARNNTVCPLDEGTPQPALQLADLIEIPSPALNPSSTPVQVEIGGKLMEVDKLVDYPLCNDNWSGTVYVSCDVQVAEWNPDEGSRFLKGCQLNIAPDAVVYVAEHNDKPHYKGCSCHTGDVYDLNK